MLQKEKVRYTFFGREDISKRVIITPLSSLYNSLFEEYPAAKETHGWWNSKDIGVDGKSISVLKVPQGYSILDALASLESPEKIVLMGYAGGNSGKVGIGSIVYPTSALRGDALVNVQEPMEREIPDSVHKGKLIHADTFLEQDEKFIERMHQEGISCVDMETFLLYSAARKNNYGAHSFLIISDLIDKKPFYEASLSDMEKIRSSYGPLEKLVVNAAKN